MLITGDGEQQMAVDHEPPSIRDAQYFCDILLPKRLSVLLCLEENMVGLIDEDNETSIKVPHELYDAIGDPYNFVVDMYEEFMTVEEEEIKDTWESNKSLNDFFVSQWKVL